MGKRARKTQLTFDVPLWFAVDDSRCTRMDVVNPDGSEIRPHELLYLALGGKDGGVAGCNRMRFIDCDAVQVVADKGSINPATASKLLAAMEMAREMRHAEEVLAAEKAAQTA